MSGFVGNKKWWILLKGHNEFHHLCQVLLKHETIGLNRVKENLLPSKKMRNRQHQTEIVDINDGYCFRFFNASEELIQPLTRTITAKSDYSKLDFQFENSYAPVNFLAIFRFFLGTPWLFCNFCWLKPFFDQLSICPMDCQ